MIWANKFLRQAELPSNNMIGLESPSKKLEVALTQSTTSLRGVDSKANVVNPLDSCIEVSTWIVADLAWLPGTISAILKLLGLYSFDSAIEFSLSMK